MTPVRTLKAGRLRRARAVVFVRDGFTCRRCGWQPPDIPDEYDGRFSVYGDHVLMIGRFSFPTRCLHVDHVVPISAGGSDGIDNLQTLCNRCNSSKGAR